MDFDHTNNLMCGRIEIVPKYTIVEYIEINHQSSGAYNSSNIKFSAETIVSELLDCSKSYNIITGFITSTTNNNLNIQGNDIGIKNCSVFSECSLRINKTEMDYSRYLNYTMLY